MEKIRSTETGIFRAPTSILCPIQNRKASKAPRGDVQPAAAAAHQNAKPAQKGAGWAESREGREGAESKPSAGLRWVISC